MVAFDNLKILVLPFKIHKSVLDLEYLQEGMLEEIIDFISLNTSMRAASRSVSLYFKDELPTGSELKSQFQIDFLIEGSLKPVNNDYILSIRLIDTTTEEVKNVQKHLFEENNWTYQIQESVKALFENASGIVTNAYQKEATTNKVRELYLKGKYHWNRYTHLELKSAISFFQKAIKEDPQYAPAYAGIANCYCVIAVMGYDFPKQSFAKAADFVKQALKYNNKHSDSYVCAALVNIFHEQEFDKARLNLDHALQLNINNNDAHHIFTFYAIYTSQLDLAHEHAEIALKEDPLSIPHYASLARISLYKRKFDDMLNYLHLANLAAPDIPELKDLAGQAYMHLGNKEQAIEEFKASIDLNPLNPIPYAFLGYCYGSIGFLEDALDVESSLINYPGPKNTGMFNFCRGILKLGLNDIDGFFSQLSLSMKEGLTAFIGELIHNPIYTEIKRDKRYIQVLKQYKVYEGKTQIARKRKLSDTVTLKTQTKEVLLLDPQNIVFVEGDGNYSTVFWYQNDVLVKKTLRANLKSLAGQLSNYTYLFRCHKSYIINIDEPIEVTGNARGYFITGSFLPKRIPVSRSNNKFATDFLKK